MGQKYPSYNSFNLFPFWWYWSFERNVPVPSWYSLPKFPGLTKIDKGTELCKNQSSDYIENMIKICDASAKTVLTHNTVGDS